MLILLAVLGTVNISAQGFKGIIPLESTCADVKRILQVEDCSYPYSLFRLKDFSVGIHFSMEKSSPEDKWCYRVPPGTVTSLTVSYRKSIRIEEFEYDLMFKERTFDDIDTIVYGNRDKGVSVMVNLGLINTAVFVPTPKQHEKLSYECNASLHGQAQRKFSNLILVEEGWRGIKPLISNKDEVEKLLGKPEIDENGYHNYRTVEAFIQVNYSTAPCKENRYNRGKYNIPEGTVLNLRVVPNRLTNLSDVKFRREKYYKDTSGDLTSSAVYRNQEDGVEIGVEIQNNIEYFSGVAYSPSKKDAEEFRCNNDSEKG